jgi:hypothetical protein
MAAFARSIPMLILALGAAVTACTPSAPTVEVKPAVEAPVTAAQPTEALDLIQTSAPTASPAPASLNAQGPYVLLEGEAGLWIANPDGSFLTRLSESGIGSADLHRAISPQGDRLAFVSKSQHGPVLLQLALPGGAQSVLATLQTVLPEDVLANPLSAQAFAYYAITQYDNVAWQPGEGRYLAFVGAIQGPTADLYVYDSQSNAITQLTDGGSQAVYPTWSPDGTTILHFGGRWVPPFGGAILGYNQADGAWAVRLEDGDVIAQPAGIRWPWNLVGWQAEGRYLASIEDEECGVRDLQSVDPAGGSTLPVLEGCYSSYAALSPEDDALLLSSSDCEACPLGAGTFLLRSGEATPQRIFEDRAWGIDWLPESGVFHTYPLGLISSDGAHVSLPPVPDASYHPAASRQGYRAWEVIENQQGRVVVAGPGQEFHTVLEADVAALIWDPLSGDTLLIAAQDGTLYAASAPDFVPRVVGDLGSRIAQVAWIP